MIRLSSMPLLLTAPVAIADIVWLSAVPFSVFCFQSLSFYLCVLGGLRLSGLGLEFAGCQRPGLWLEGSWASWVCHGGLLGVWI